MEQELTMVIGRMDFQDGSNSEIVTVNRSVGHGTILLISFENGFVIVSTAVARR
jgi:hypothetical protein